MSFVDADGRRIGSQVSKDRDVLLSNHLTELELIGKELLRMLDEEITISSKISTKIPLPSPQTSNFRSNSDALNSPRLSAFINQGNHALHP